MIPPSILMVIYCIITGASLGKLLIAGILPGVLLALGFMVLTYFRVKRTPQLAPLLGEKITWGEKFRSLKNIWGIALLAVLVLGGIYTGAFTPIEAGAVGACGAFAGRRLEHGRHGRGRCRRALRRPLGVDEVR